jgi:glycerophosphoryl diester phosphodiesterase
VLAHRGLATANTENTMAAFRAAVAAGADYIETDVHASSDGVAVVSHDPTLERVADRLERVDALTLEALRTIDLGGEGFATLEEVLTAFPAARFNIDIKSQASARPAAEAIAAAGAVDRVLITSFSRARRRAAVRRLAELLPGRRVAVSAAAKEFVPALVLVKLGLVPLARLVLRGVDAVQIPQEVGPLRTTTVTSIRRLQRAGVEVHVWTINDVGVARELLDRGADGIVTDRADLLLELVASR